MEQIATFGRKRDNRVHTTRLMASSTWTWTSGQFCLYTSAVFDLAYTAATTLTSMSRMPAVNPPAPQNRSIIFNSLRKAPWSALCWSNALPL